MQQDARALLQTPNFNGKVSGVGVTLNGTVHFTHSNIMKE